MLEEISKKLDVPIYHDPVDHLKVGTSRIYIHNHSIDGDVIIVDTPQRSHNLKQDVDGLIRNINYFK